VPAFDGSVLGDDADVEHPAPVAPDVPATGLGRVRCVDWSRLAGELTEALSLHTAPVAITFGPEPPVGVDTFDAPMPAPTADGRTGRVPAGCVFWTHAVERTFTTVAEDHANCSVGSVTHGFRTLEEVADRADVATLLDTGWVTADFVPRIPVVTERPGSVTYGPLVDTPIDPDVVLLRLNPKQLMVLVDAVPDLRIDSKPQCHIVAVAKEDGEVAASVGCALSRARTGMPATELTCAIPAPRLEEVAALVTASARTDTLVARYAADDATRFA
jgi:uncharacterized protein (DUF169 family)